MVNDEVSIYNLALGVVGSRSNIQATTDPSREAEVCRLWYSPVRDQVLSAARWPSATAFKRLAAVADVEGEDEWADGLPAPGFSNSFSVPTDMLRPQNLTTHSKFIIARSGSDLVLSANEETPILAYTSRNTVVGQWDSELQMAIVYGLAAHIARPLTGKRALSKDVLEMANALITAARVAAANSDDNRMESLPDWMVARGVNAVGFSQAYYYPAGPLLSVSNVG